MYTQLKHVQHNTHLPCCQFGNRNYYLPPLRLGPLYDDVIDIQQYVCDVIMQWALLTGRVARQCHTFDIQPVNYVNQYVHLLTLC